MNEHDFLISIVAYFDNSPCCNKSDKSKECIHIVEIIEQMRIARISNIFNAEKYCRKYLKATIKCPFPVLKSMIK